MRKWRRMGLWIFWLAAPLVGVSGSPPAAKVQPLKSVSMLASRSGVVPGQSLDLALRVRLRPEFHVNSHTPRQKFLIPTTLEADSPPGMNFAEWDFPTGEEHTFPFSAEPLQVYEGEFLIRGRVSIAQETAPGHLEAVVQLRYQACTKEKCYAPRREKITVEIEVVAAGFPTQPLHPEVFAPRDP